MKNKNQGITLIALIITVIVLLILAGVTIGMLTGKDGMLAKINQAKEESEQAHIKEEVELAIQEFYMEKAQQGKLGEVNLKNLSEYLSKKLDNVVIKELTSEKMANVETTQVVNEKLIIEYKGYEIEINNKYNVRILGKVGVVKPSITLVNISNTANTITVEVSTKRNEGGKIQYYYKTEDDAEYKLYKETENTTFIYEQLEQNKNYNLKIVAVASNGQTAEVLVDRTTRVLVTSINLNKISTTIEVNKTETLIATVNPSDATNKEVSWSSTDENVITVSNEGVVTAKAVGTAYVKVIAQDGSGITVDCKVEVKEPAFASKIDTSNYGDYVNYGIDLGIASAGNELSDSTKPKTDWRIFYDDGIYVYLIASDYLPASKFPSGVFGKNNGKYNGNWVINTSTKKLSTSGTVTGNKNFLFTKLSSLTESNYNYQAVAILLDTSKWKNFAKTDYVEDINTAVIGTPTVEMWMASWNKRYEGEKLSFDVNEYGYKIGINASSLGVNIDNGTMNTRAGYKNTLYYPHYGKTFNSCQGYWLASPGGGDEDNLINVYYAGSLNRGYYPNPNCNDTNYGVRPVVCLKAEIKATKDANEIWQLGN